MRILNKASEISMGQLTIVSTNDHSVVFGTECGETLDVRSPRGVVKILLIQLPANADYRLALDSVLPFHNLCNTVREGVMEVRALVYSSQFAKGTPDDAARSGISSVELATGSLRLIIPGYTHLDAGEHRTYPEAAAVKSLATKRGRDLLLTLWSIPARPRWTTQSLQKAATQVTGKTISSSVVHRFISKLRDLELIATAGATGFCLTQEGKRQIEAELSDILTPSNPVGDPSMAFAP